MTTPTDTFRAAKVTRKSDYDADGRATFLVEWQEGERTESCRWTGTVADLALVLSRNNLRAVRT